MKIDLFHQVLRFSPFWISIDLLLILHFLFSWYFSAKKTGWKIDFWYFTLLISLFVPLLLMYPFNASIYNVISTGTGYEQLEPLVDRAFGISVLGYLFFWIGRYLYDKGAKKLPFFSLCLLFQPFEKLVEKNISSKQVVHWLFLLTLILCSIILFITLREGYFLHPRDFFLKADALRPLFNIAITLLPLSILFLILRSLQFKESLGKALALILISLSFGLRSVTISAILSTLIYRIFSKEGKISLIKLGAIAVFLSFLLLYMDNVRQGEGNPFFTVNHFFFKLFYGNHFSDTRDFAWILANWDESFLYGKTYLAGFISFLPRFLSPFRQEWSSSTYTNTLLGFDSSEHAGLRPTIFGESFLNFSYPGVILLGLLSGYLLRYADVMLKESIVIHKNVIKAYSKTIVYAFISAFFISNALWSFYLFIFLNLCFSLIRKKPKESATLTYKREEKRRI